MVLSLVIGAASVGVISWWWCYLLLLLLLLLLSLAGVVAAAVLATTDIVYHYFCCRCQYYCYCGTAGNAVANIVVETLKKRG